MFLFPARFIWIFLQVQGEVAEWSMAQHWKCCIGATLSRVRIPLSPLMYNSSYLYFSSFKLKFNNIDLVVFF